MGAGNLHFSSICLSISFPRIELEARSCRTEFL